MVSPGVVEETTVFLDCKYGVVDVMCFVILILVPELNLRLIRVVFKVYFKVI